MIRNQVLDEVIQMCHKSIEALHQQYEVIDIGDAVGMWQLVARRVSQMKDEER